MSDYTPTTEEVREHYVEPGGYPLGPQREAEFIRWLAGVKAEARTGFADELTRLGVYTLDIHQIRKHARGEA